ncbi:MAG TPA: coproporphyrinogen III oxidase, partial [Bacillota bacterium]|nr:coproporphyrinogen III oxidase [Bacillota bacterium]
MRPRWLGIYVHVPFCLSKCSYCAFVSYPGAVDPHRAGRYVDTVLKELGTKAPMKDDRHSGWTLFIG